MTKLDFCSILFLCFFFPIFFFFYYFLPRKYKNEILLIGSLIFIFIGRGNLIWYFLLITGFTYFSFYLLSNLPKQISKKKLLCCIILVDCFIWFFFIFKFQSKNWIYPICYMVILLENIGSLLDFYHKKESIPNIKLYFTYASCFPKLLIGPIFSYNKMEKELQNRAITPSKFSDGIFLFLKGLSIRILIVESLSSFHQSLLSIQISIGSFFLLLLVTALEITLWLKSYSDMGSGLGTMLGFSWKKESTYPLMSLSFQEFLEKWHFSVLLWWKKYASFFKKKMPMWIKIICFMFFLSLTYGMNLSIFYFFFTIGIFLFIEEIVKKKTSKFVFYLFHFVLLFIPFLFLIDEKWLLNFSPFPIFTPECIYFLTSYFLVLLMALGISCKGFSILSNRLKNYPVFFQIRSFIYFILLIMVLVFIISGIENLPVFFFI